MHARTHVIHRALQAGKPVMHERPHARTTNHPGEKWRLKERRSTSARAARVTPPRHRTHTRMHTYTHIHTLTHVNTHVNTRAHTHVSNVRVLLSKATPSTLTEHIV